MMLLLALGIHTLLLGVASAAAGGPNGESASSQAPTSRVTVGRSRRNGVAGRMAVVY